MRSPSSPGPQFCPAAGVVRNQRVGAFKIVPGAVNSVPACTARLGKSRRELIQVLDSRAAPAIDRNCAVTTRPRLKLWVRIRRDVVDSIVGSVLDARHTSNRPEIDRPYHAAADAGRPQ